MRKIECDICGKEENIIKHYREKGFRRIEGYDLCESCQIRLIELVKREVDKQ